MIKCNRCNELKNNGHYLASEEHPLAFSGYIPVCFECLKENISDYKNLNKVTKLFQVLDMAFYPDEWVKLAEEYDENPLIYYFNIYQNKGFGKKRQDWTELSDLWSGRIEDGSAPSFIESLKDAHISELRIKWKGEHSYNDLLALESYERKMNNDFLIRNERDADFVRKMAKLSLIIDQTLEMGGDVKNLLDSYKKIHDMAELESASEREGAVTSISEITEFMEETGYQPKFHFSTPKDTVDKTLEDIKEYTRLLVEGEPNLAEIVALKREKLNERKKKLGLEAASAEEQRFKDTLIPKEIVESGELVVEEEEEPFFSSEELDTLNKEEQEVEESEDIKALKEKIKLKIEENKKKEEEEKNKKPLKFNY